MYRRGYGCPVTDSECSLLVGNMLFTDKISGYTIGDIYQLSRYLILV